MFKNKKTKLILASQSPRRQQLLKDLGFDFEIKTKAIEEIYPKKLQKEQITIFLSELKASVFYNDIQNNEIVITADTIVCLGNQILGKPKNSEDAILMLNKLSNKKHEVITAVTLLSKNKKKSFFASTEVYFKALSNKEITYYVTTFKPYDKAGAYGIQEWIGYIGVKKIIGSYFNVMGLPVQELYEELLNF